MYKITLAKIGKPKGIIMEGYYDDFFLKLTFDRIEEAGAYLNKLHGFERVTYDVIKIG